MPEPPIVLLPGIDISFDDFIGRVDYDVHLLDAFDDYSRALTVRGLRPFPIWGWLSL